MNDDQELDCEVGTCRVRCACGFEAVSGNSAALENMLEDHPCPHRPDAGPEPWYSYLFSFWAWAIVATIGYFLMVIFGVWHG